MARGESSKFEIVSKLLGEGEVGLVGTRTTSVEGSGHARGLTNKTLVMLVASAIVSEE